MSPHRPSIDTPDTVLVRRFLDGSEPAFRTLYERHTPRLRMLVLRLLGRDRHELDDVVQETWIAASRGVHAYRGDASFATWISAIGVRIALHRLPRFRRDEGELTDDIPSPLDGGPATVIDLERALAALPDHQRVVVVLHDVEGFTHEEIAEQLGIAAGTSKGTLSRARQALRRALTEGVTNGT
ncbi:MAG: RNA polymerase sigma factor [Gemmatimonadaceae bacterium]